MRYVLITPAIRVLTVLCLNFFFLREQSKSTRNHHLALSVVTVFHFWSVHPKFACFNKSDYCLWKSLRYRSALTPTFFTSVVSVLLVMGAMRSSAKAESRKHSRCPWMSKMFDLLLITLSLQAHIKNDHHDLQGQSQPPSVSQLKDTLEDDIICLKY